MAAARASFLSATLAILIGILALIGWWLGVPALYSVLPDLPAMVPATAVLVVLTGSGLLLTPAAASSATQKIAALACAVPVVATSALFLFWQGTIPMPASATSFVLLALGIALLLLQLAKPPELLLGGVSVFAVTLPLYRVAECLLRLGQHHEVTAGDPFATTALNTALALCLLAGPALFLHPRLPFGRNLFAADASARLMRVIMPWGTIAPVLMAVVIEYGIHHEAGVTIFVIIAALGLFGAMATAALWRGYDKLRVATAVLQRNEGLTRSIMDSLPHSIAVIDRNGTIVSVNASWRSFAASNAADPATFAGIGLDYLDSCRRIPDDAFAQQALAGIEGLLAGRHEGFALEYPCHSPEQQRWFALRASPLRDGSGGLVISHIDITERKLAELHTQHDREQQASLRQMLETIVHGETLDKTLGECLDLLLAVPWLAVLPRGGIHLMAENGEHLDLTVSRGLPAAVRSQCGHLPLDRCLCGKAAASHQLVFASRVDARHEVSYPNMADHGHYCVPLLDSRQQVMGVLVLYLVAGSRPEPAREQFLHTVADILASYILRKRSEMALQAAEAELRQEREQLELKVHERTTELATSEARTRAVLHTMADAVILIDSRGSVLLANYAITPLFGYEPEEIIGRNVSMLMPEPERSRHDGYLARYRATLQHRIIGRRLEVSGQRKDGTTFPLELAVNELVDDAGITFIGVLRDLTLQRTAERSLETARREAERLARIKSDFLANMSHEIRTPLGAVLGFARIGMRENRGRRSHAICERIFKSGEHLLAVVNDILDFSKIEAGKLIIDPHPMPLAGVIDEAVGLVADRAAEKNLVLQSRSAAGLPAWVLGDALRIRQILVNLLTNAVKFTERGQVELSVARERDDIRFTVRDEGIGMTDEQLARLFQPFEQADSSTTRKHGGSGLGLTISLQLARLMGGDIDVVSVPGRGSTFTLRLPLPEAAAAAQEKAEGAPGTTRRLVGIRVLAAEDIDVNRLILADMLEQEGALVVFAQNGLEAVMRVEADPDACDVVLMDVQMPVMDGYAATRRIAQIAPRLPVIGLTAHALAEEREHGREAGMIDHVTKPIEPDVLVATILRHLAARPAAQSAPVEAPPAAPPAPTIPDRLIDWPALSARFGNKEDFVRKLIASALDSLGDSGQKLAAAIAERDFKALAFLAHSLKGVAGNLLAQQAFELAQATDGAARNGLPEAFELAARLAELVAALRAELAEQNRIRSPA